MIDTFFKEYFWSFHLVALAVAGMLSARAANVFVREALRVPPTAAQSGRRAAPNKKDPRISTVATRAFLDRNLFRAEREDLTPEPEPAGPTAEAAAKQAAAQSGEVDTSNCEKSALRANLVATVVSSDKEASVAVFVDPGKNQAESHRVKDKVLGQAEIISIEWRRVLVNNAGRCELFSIEDDAKPASARGSPVPAVAAKPKPKSGAPKMELGKGVKKINDSEYEIPKSDIEGVLGNLNVVATQARIVPSFRNGKANGFKLFSIRPGSLYSKIGIQNGDIIQKINGYEINSPDKALEIYSKLKDAENITVDLVRRGRGKTLSYGIR